MDSDEWYVLDLDKPEPKRYITFDILKSFDITHFYKNNILQKIWE